MIFRTISPIEYWTSMGLETSGLISGVCAGIWAGADSIWKYMAQKKREKLEANVPLRSQTAPTEHSQNLPNKLPLPTPASDTPAAGAPVAPPSRAAGPERSAL
jgi:hypothetical protein